MKGLRFRVRGLGLSDLGSGCGLAGYELGWSRLSSWLRLRNPEKMSAGVHGLHREFVLRFYSCFWNLQLLYEVAWGRLHGA